MSSALVKNADCRELLLETGEGDFIYIDPPYARNSKRDRGEYGTGALKDEDVASVLDATVKAAKRGAKILFSYNRDIGDALPSWKSSKISHRYLISADTKTRKHMCEYLYWNY